MISVLYINNAGGGFAETHPVDEGTTFGDFVSARITDTQNYSIRLNADAASHETVLEDGDRIVVTPLKTEGGA